MTSRTCSDRWRLLLLAAAAFLPACADYYDDDDDDCRIENGQVVQTVDDDDDFYDDDDDGCIVFQSNSGGTVVVITDLPSEDVSSLLITVRRVRFLSDEVETEPVYDSAEGVRMDLLSLRRRGGNRFFEVLLATELAPAVYHGIELELAEPSLVLDSGEVVPPAAIELAGAGRLEVGFPPTPVGPDQTVRLVLDFDVARSLSEVPAGALRPGASRQWSFRPLVYPEVVERGFDAHAGVATDVRGSVGAYDPTTGELELELEGARGRLPVRIAETTWVVGDDLVLLDGQSLAPGDEVRVRGRWLPGGELDATSIARGDTAEIRGVAAGVTLLGDGGALLAVRPTGDGDVAPPVIEVRVERESLVYIDRREAVMPAELAPGSTVVVTLLGGGTDIAPPPAAVVDLRSPAPALSAEGGAWQRTQVVAVDVPRRRLELAGPAGRLSLDVPAGLEPMRIEEGPQGLRESPLWLGELTPGVELDVELDPASGALRRVLSIAGPSGS